jgi:coenzyme PQQ precursor peptide PqqA
MKWSKPTYENRRFGFEITMYVYIAAQPNLIQAKNTSGLTVASFETPTTR